MKVLYEKDEYKIVYCEERGRFFVLINNSQEQVGCNTFVGARRQLQVIKSIIEQH